MCRPAQPVRRRSEGASNRKGYLSPRLVEFRTDRSSVDVSDNAFFLWLLVSGGFRAAAVEGAQAVEEAVAKTFAKTVAGAVAVLLGLTNQQ
jgi:hypothetical protein